MATNLITGEEIKLGPCETTGRWGGFALGLAGGIKLAFIVAAQATTEISVGHDPWVTFIAPAIGIGAIVAAHFIYNAVPDKNEFWNYDHPAVGFPIFGSTVAGFLWMLAGVPSKNAIQADADKKMTFAICGTAACMIAGSASSIGGSIGRWCDNNLFKNRRPEIVPN